MPAKSSFKKSEQYGIPALDHKRYFSSVSKFSEYAALGLYKLTGNTIDVSQESIDYLIGAWGGGLGDTVNKAVNIIPSMARRRSLQSHEIPVLRSFYAGKNKFYASQMYRANLAQHWQKWETWNDLKKTEPQEAAAYQRRWAHLINLHDQAKSVEKQVKQLRGLEISNDDSRLQKIYKRFNLMYDRVEANKRRQQRANPSIMN